MYFSASVNKFLSKSVRLDIESGKIEYSSDPNVMRAFLMLLNSKHYKFGDELRSGRLLYNPVDEMNRGEPVTIVLKLALGSQSTLSLPEALPGQRVEKSTVVTPEMSAELTGSAGLAVEPGGIIKKGISALAPTVWQWKVTPNKGGEEVLRLSTYIHLDSDEPLTFKSYEDVIFVNVSTWQKTQDLIAEIDPVWGLLVGGGFIPAIWGLWVWIGKRRDQQS